MPNTTTLSRRSNAPLGALVDQFFDDAFFTPNRLRRAENGGDGAWLPAVDLSQTPERFVVRVDLPGLKREDIDVTVENNTLTLRGERKFEQHEETESYNRIERVYGAFTRSFQLPNNVDSGKVKATFEDGVLTIDIPKTEEAKSKRVEIG
jgi:HSP20 family protein